MLNRLYAIDTYMHHKFLLVMSLPAMSLGLRFYANGKGGTGGGGRVSTLGPDSMAKL